jgi:hypothetical protein
MFNLLPESLRDGLKKEYRLRRLTIILIFVVFIELSFLIFLFPTWLNSLYKEKGLAAEALKSGQVSVDENLNGTISTIKTLNSKLSTIDMLNYPGILPFIDIILSKKTKSISITQINYASSDSNNATLSISGISANRDSLVSFVKSLEDSKSFKSVNSPISNFAKDKNINFSINLVISQSNV